ncbi:MAG: hypothetical protein DSM106950_30200 [Stigonema ocellatum SAG 48.90 = DSM 106950]|nr:hypothetical protein [Stigonema ocellatum SAG 48.90 = DSM 106950]
MEPIQPLDSQDSCCYQTQNAAGIISSGVEVYNFVPRPGVGCFFRLCFHALGLLISASVNPQRLSDCALSPASSSRNRVWSTWADRESHLNLVDGTFTRIRPEVQPLMTVICCQVGGVMYGLDTVIHPTTNRTSFHHTVWQTIVYSMADNSIQYGRQECICGVQLA